MQEMQWPSMQNEIILLILILFLRLLFHLRDRDDSEDDSENRRDIQRNDALK